MKSMTGFGSSFGEANGLMCTVEIKSVNSRFFDLTIRCNQDINPYEHSIRQLLSSVLDRGKVEVSISLQNTESRPKSISINRVLKKQIQNLLVNEGFYKDIDEVPLQDIMSISKDWVHIEDDTIDEKNLGCLIEDVCKRALEQLVDMRSREGKILQEDLEKRLHRISQIHKEIDNHKEAALIGYKTHLANKLAKALEGFDIEVEKERFLQEVTIVADKTDITEEIVRFGSHVVQLKNTLADLNPIGRKLDFLLQEMNREVNTMGSKGANLAITERVVQLKCELEKVREQVQNIE